MLGADTLALSTVRARIDRCSEALARGLDGVARADDPGIWVGPDREHFDQGLHVARTQVDTASRRLQTMADELSMHVEEQDLASAPDIDSCPRTLVDLQAMLGRAIGEGVVEDVLRRLFGASGSSTEDSLGGFEDPRRVSTRTLDIDREAIEAFDPRAVVQGDTFGDCWFLATLASVAEQNPDLIAENIRLVEGATPDEDHWIVTLYDDGEPIEHIVTQDELVTDGVRERIDHENGSYSERISWMSIYERAAVEHVGGDYGALEGNFAGAGFEMITGDDGRLTIDMSFESVRQDLESGRSVVSSTPPGWIFGGAPDGDVVDGHVYVVEGFSTNAHGEEVVVLVNPWGTPSPPASKPSVIELTQTQYAMNFASRNTVDHG